MLLSYYKEKSKLLETTLIQSIYLLKLSIQIKYINIKNYPSRLEPYVHNSQAKTTFTH